jgi:phenylalanyl-tRNA synthetase beta chain
MPPVNIFLEAAHFDMRAIRRSSQRHGLKTNAAKLFERGSDPNNTLYALKRAALLIQELAGGTIASEVSRYLPKT